MIIFILTFVYIFGNVKLTTKEADDEHSILGTSE